MDKNRSSQIDAWVDERLTALKLDDGWQPNAVAGLTRLKELHDRGNRTARRLSWAAAAGALGTFCLVVLPSPRVLAHRCVECSVVVWKNLSGLASSQADVKPERGRTEAPDFALKGEDGKAIRLAGLKGKVIVVNFWATWCEGCQVEIPWFIEFEKKYAESGLVVVGVSMDADGWKSVKPWVTEKKVNYPIVIGNENLARQYGLKAMPLTVLVDRDGRIADVHSGLVKRTATEKKIRTLLGENSKSP
jgi:peroxiredoxin